MKAPPVRRTRRKSRAPSGTFFRQSGGKQPAFFTATDPAVQRKCEACAAEKEDGVQRKESGPGAPAPRATSYVRGLAGRGGEALSAAAQTFFRARMGHDFSGVRVHRDAEAAESATALHAQAYTIGEHIVFNRERFAPETEEGRRLLAHELVHVTQQRDAGFSPARMQRMPEGETPQETPAEPASEPKGESPAEPKAEEAKAREKEEPLSEPVTLPDFSTFGKPSRQTDFAKNVTFRGQTDGLFDGGTGQTKNLKAIPAKSCEGCGSAECFTVTGILEVTYHVSTTVTLPDVPTGLTPCQEQRVRDAINNTLQPHEAQHVAAFETYNGTVKLPINFTGCKANLAAHVQAMHDADGAARETAARAKSAALDPFHVNVDLDCQDAPPPKK